MKAVTFFPRNEGTELDSHQGAVLLFEAGRGRLLAVIDATSVTAIRTAAVSGLATRLLAREDAGDLALVGSGVQARTHLEAMRCVRHDPPRPRREQDAASARRPSPSGESKRHGIAITPCATVARGRRRAPTSSAPSTSSREPILRGEWLSPGAHVNAVGSSVAAARELDTAAVVRSRLFVDRRESALERGRRLPASPKKEGAVGDDAHRRRDRRGRRSGTVAGPPRRRRDHALQVARPRDRGPRRGAAHLREGARRPASARSSSSAEAATKPIEPPSRLEEIRAARERASRGSALRTPLVRLDARRAAAEIWLKLENLQPIGSFKLRGAGNAMALAPPGGPRARRLHRERRQHGAGRGLERAAPRRPLHRRRARTRAPQAKLDGDRAARRADRQGAVRPLVAGARRARLSRASTGSSSIPSPIRAVIAGNGTIGLEILEDLPDVDTILVPCGGGGLSCGIAVGGRALCARGAGLRLRGRDGGAALAPRSPRARPSPIDYTRELRRRHRRGGACSRRCGRSRAALLAGSLVVVARGDRRRRARSSRRGTASSPRARAPRPSPPRSPAARRRGKIVCVVSGGNIDAGEARARSSQAADAGSRPTEKRQPPRNTSALKPRFGRTVSGVRDSATSRASTDPGPAVSRAGRARRRPPAAGS